MIISEKQICQLMRYTQKYIDDCLHHEKTVRARNLLDNIANQQSDQLKEIKNEPR